MALWHLGDLWEEASVYKVHGHKCQIFPVPLDISERLYGEYCESDHTDKSLDLAAFSAKMPGTQKSIVEGKFGLTHMSQYIHVGSFQKTEAQRMSHFTIQARNFQASWRGGIKFILLNTFDYMCKQNSKAIYLKKVLKQAVSSVIGRNQDVKGKFWRHVDLKQSNMFNKERQILIGGQSQKQKLLGEHSDYRVRFTDKLHRVVSSRKFLIF